jgi:hypothetical protein
MNTQVKSAALYVTFVGSLVNGYQAVAIDDKAETERLFYKNESRRVHSQYTELQDPAEVSLGYDADRGGNTVVFIGSVKGGQMFGPFADEDLAEAFAADFLRQHDRPEHAFELFTVKESHTQRN